MNGTSLLLVFALAAAPVTLVAGFLNVRLTAPVAVLTSAAAFAAAMWGWHEPGEQISYTWVESWGLRFQFELDGLGAMYALLATGVGLAVAAYSATYMPLHQEHERQPGGEIVRYYTLLLLFMGAMTGLVMAEDLILVFLFWDLTAITSYFLIGFDAHRADARSAAFMALTVTGISAMALLVGFLMMADEYGTSAVDTIVSAPIDNDRMVVAGVLILIGALAKSAQAPLHFWLPRAMAAPTPVSAYLHAAAMVAAGVFMIGRFYPVLAIDELLSWILLACGIFSMLGASVTALTRTNLKQILAYSTISQYGYVVAMFGLGGEHGVAAATFYVIAHALAKAALFLTAGAVTEATGVRDLRFTGGLWRQLPWLAAASGVAAASLAALPLTLGFFKDELVFETANLEGTAWSVLMVVAAALSFAYTGRFWYGIFGGKAMPGDVKPVRGLTVPIFALALLTLVGGIWPEPAARLASLAASDSLHAPVSLELGYHLSLEREMLMAGLAWLLGLGILLSSRWWQIPVNRSVDLARHFGPERIYVSALHGINELSDRIHWIEVRDLRSRVTTILVPGALLIVMALIATRGSSGVETGSVQASDWPIIFITGLATMTAVTAAVANDHFSMALALSAVGFCLAGVYAVLRSPDVALVALLVETIFGLVFFAVMAMLPKDVAPAEVVPSDRQVRDVHRLRDVFVSVIAGLIAFAVAWTTLSQKGGSTALIEEQIATVPLAHGEDIVTVILADFRGFDTMGEITVIAIAFTGIATLLTRRLQR